MLNGRERYKMAWEISLVLTFVGIAFALFFAGQSLDKDHYPLKLLFLVIGLLFLLANFANTTQIINAYNATINNANITSALTNISDVSYNGFIWVVIFVMLYFVIYFIYKTVKSVRLKQQEEDGN